MLLNGSLPLCLGIVAVNTQDFELTLILLVVLLHLRHTLDTPDTPRTPEVDDYILATKAGKREWLAIDIIQSEIRSLYTRSLNLLSLLLHLCTLLGTFEDWLIVCLHSTILHLSREHINSLLHILAARHFSDESSTSLVIRMLTDECQQFLLLCLCQSRSLLIIFLHQCLTVTTILHLLADRLLEISQLLVSFILHRINLGKLLVEVATLDIKLCLQITYQLSSLTRHTNQLESYSTSATENRRLCKHHLLRFIQGCRISKLILLYQDGITLFTSTLIDDDGIAHILQISLELESSALSHCSC